MDDQSLAATAIGLTALGVVLAYTLRYHREQTLRELGQGAADILRDEVRARSRRVLARWVGAGLATAGLGFAFGPSVVESLNITTRTTYNTDIATEGAASPTYDFESLWDAATGQGNTAITDGGKWDDRNDLMDVPIAGQPDTAEVFTGGPQGLNYLRTPVCCSGNPRGALLSAFDVRPIPDNTTDTTYTFYQRVYVRVNGLTNSNAGLSDHGYVISSTRYGALGFLHVNGGASSSWNARIEIARETGSAADSPEHHFHLVSGGAEVELSDAVWYRVEHHIELVYLSTYSAWFIDDLNVRFYDASTDSADDTDTILWDETDWRDENDFTNGKQLSALFDAANDTTAPSQGIRAMLPDIETGVDTFYGTNPLYFGIAMIGTNGQSGWTAEGWKDYAGMVICSACTDWIGRHGG